MKCEVSFPRFREEWLGHRVAGAMGARFTMNGRREFFLSRPFRADHTVVHSVISQVADEAIQAFEKLGPAAREAVPTLLEILDELRSVTYEPSRKGKAAKALRKIDSKAAAKIGLL
jgi:hypothetical protein